MDHDYKKYEPIFGAWEITEQIGSGSEGQMYRIRREDSLKHEYFSALKAVTIPQNGEDDIKSLMAGGTSREEVEAYYEGFINKAASEFDLMAKLKGNSHIVSYEDHEIFKHTDDFGWDILIRMEELTPLVDYSLEHPLSTEDVAKMGADILKGLVFLRQYDIVHRDIKPENIFVAPSGDFKLGDFGIARMIEDTKTSLSRKGTYSYMAPEVYRGEAYGASVDIYSLGLVMYKYLNDGRLPFMPKYPEPLKYGDREDAFIRRVREAEVPGPRNGSEELKRIVLKACAFRREDRYKDAAEMLFDLETLIYGDASETAKKLKKEQDRRKKKGRRIFFAVAALVAVVGVIIYFAIPKAVTAITGLEPITEMYMGEALEPEYSVEPDWFKDEPITFASGNDEVFTVSDEGVIQAKDPGEAVLTLSAREFTEQVVIKVVPKVTEIKTAKDSLKLVEGESAKLKTELLPEEFADEEIVYTSEDESVAVVNSHGGVTAIKAGSTVITIYSGGCTKEIKVKVREPKKEPKAEDKDKSGEAGTSMTSNTSDSQNYTGTQNQSGWTPSNNSSSSRSSSSRSSSSNSSSSSSSSSKGNGDEGWFSDSDDEYFD